MKFEKGNKYSVGNKNNLGRKMTALQKSKISISLKGKNTWAKGVKLSEETKKKIRNGKLGKKFTEAHKMAISNAHINRPEWRGGSWDYWKKQTLLRENYTCQVCQFRDEEIAEVDHILPKSLYPELRLDLNNLQVLCPNCHRRKTNREAKMCNSKKKKNHN